jgi:ZIP family zinc transporter
MKMRNILLYALCFSARAMIFVVVEKLIPEAQRKYINIDTVTIVGFSVMMILGVALG